METGIAQLIGPMPLNTDKESYWQSFTSLLSPAGPAAKEQIKNKMALVFIDGGWRHFQSFESFFKDTLKADRPFLHWIGDGDGLAPKFKDDPPWKEISKTQLSPDKDKSDLLAGLEWISASHTKTTGLSLDKVFAHGFIGGRLDHQLAVLGDLTNWLVSLAVQKNPIQPRPPVIHLIDEKGRDAITLFTGELTTKHQGTFSVFSSKVTRVTIEGSAKFTGNNIELRPNSSRGLSNLASGDFTLSCDEGPITLIKNYD